MKLAKIITDEADEIILRIKWLRSQDALHRALTFTQSIAADAHHAYLDGKMARARSLNKLADKVRYAALSVRIDQ